MVKTNRKIEDSLTKHVFVVKQAPGLNEGEVGLFFKLTSDRKPEIKKGQIICLYGNKHTMKLIPIRKWRKYKNSKKQKHYYYKYGIEWEKNKSIMYPKKIRISIRRLGLFANGRKSSDPNRSIANARLSKDFKNKKITLKSTRTIYKNEEIVLSYGREYSLRL